MKLNDLFKDLATKAGVDLKNPALADVLAINAELPDDVAQVLQANLLTMESAKNNPAIKSHYFAQAMGGVDTELERIWADPELFTADEIAEMKKEFSSTKRMVQTISKQREKLEAKLKAVEAGGKAKPGEADELRNKINELNLSIGGVKQTYEDKITALNAQHATELTNIALDMHLGTYTYSMPKDTPAGAKIAAAKAVLMPEITNKGLKLERINGVLQLLKADGTKYFNELQQEVSFSDFANKLLAENKMLAASVGAGDPPPPPPPGAGGAGKNADLLAQVNQDLANAGL